MPLAPRNGLAISADLFDCLGWVEGLLSASRGVEAGDAAKHSKMHRTAAIHRKESSSPKC